MTLICLIPFPRQSLGKKTPGLQNKKDKMIVAAAVASAATPFVCVLMNELAQRTHSQEVYV